MNKYFFFLLVFFSARFHIQANPFPVYSADNSNKKDTIRLFTKIEEALQSPKDVYRLRITDSEIEKLPAKLTELVNLRELTLKY